LVIDWRTQTSDRSSLIRLCACVEAFLGDAESDRCASKVEQREDWETEEDRNWSVEWISEPDGHM